MKEDNLYLQKILAKYAARDLTRYSDEINQLKRTLVTWANSCYLDILDSGSRSKGTAISLASDVDYLVTLKHDCEEGNGGLKKIYESLFTFLSQEYRSVRKQNVSVRIQISDLEIDVTPARKHFGSTNVYSLYTSKADSWIQTNTIKHINDIIKSDRKREIKLIKIWRELHKLDFPSIYLEYLIISKILHGRTKGIYRLNHNFQHVFNELAKDKQNPLFLRIVDPANSNNILSDT